MADDPQKPETPASAADAATADKPTAAADKPASGIPSEPLKGEVSRTDSPGAGVSAAKPPAAPAAKSPAAKPAAPAAVGAEAGAPKAPARPTAPAAKPAASHEPPKAAPPAGPTEPPPPADMALPAFITALQSAIPGAVTQISYYVGDWTIVVPPTQLLSVARFLCDAPEAQFDYCSDITATDWPPRAERFDVVYMLYSVRRRHRVRVKVKVAENQPLPSMCAIWPAANWLEREVYDMFGVNITGHPDRRRILMPLDWQGFPQRKDYPLEGPGELLMENPIDWLKLKQARDEADIE